MEVSLYSNDGYFIYINDDRVLYSCLNIKRDYFYLEYKDEFNVIFYLYIIVNGKKIYICNGNMFNRMHESHIFFKTLEEMKFYHNKIEFFQEENCLRPIIYSIFGNKCGYISLERYLDKLDETVIIQRVRLIITEELLLNGSIIKIKTYGDLDCGLK